MKVAPRFKLHSHCFTLLTSLLKLVIREHASTSCAAKTMTYYADMYFFVLSFLASEQNDGWTGWSGVYIL